MATPNVFYEASTFQGRKLTGQRDSLRRQSRTRHGQLVLLQGWIGKASIVKLPQYKVRTVVNPMSTDTESLHKP